MWTKCHRASCVFSSPKFHRAMPKFRGYLRRLIILAEEGFHGWAEIYICLLWSKLPYYSNRGELLLAWKSGGHKATGKLCCALGSFSPVTFSTSDTSRIQFSILPHTSCSKPEGEDSSQHCHCSSMLWLVSNSFSIFHFAAVGSQKWHFSFWNTRI